MQGLSDLAQESAIVKISPVVAEIMANKFFIEALLEHVKSEVAPIEQDARMGAARGRDSGGAKEFPADNLGHEAGVLHGIIEVDLVDAVKFLVLVEFIEVERESRTGQIIQAAKTSSGALQMNGNVVVGLVGFANGAANIIAGVLAEGV